MKLTVRESFVALVVVLAAGAGAAGCDAGVSPTTPRASDEARTVSYQVKARIPALPLDEVDLTPADRDTISAARSALVVQCLNRVGVTVSVGTKIFPGEGAIDTNLSNRRYGVPDLETAKLFGYHVPPVPAPGTRETGSAIDFSAPAASQCLTDADQRLAPGGTDLMTSSKLSAINQGSYAASEKRPTVISATAEWASCMKTSGWSFSDPMASVADPRWHTASPSGEEVAAAVADATCKAKTHLIAVWSGEEANIQHSLIEDGGQGTQLEITRLQTQLKTAKAVLGATK